MWEEFGQLPLLSKAKARKCGAAQCPACSSMRQPALLLVACLHNYKEVKAEELAGCARSCCRVLPIVAIAQGQAYTRARAQAARILERSAWTECMHTA